MSYTKDLFTVLAENALRNYQLMDLFPSDDSKLQSESFEVVKGDYRSTINCKFNEKGYLVNVQVDSKIIETESEKLERLIREAVKNRDFKAAASLQEQLDKLESN